MKSFLIILAFALSAQAKIEIMTIGGSVSGRTFLNNHWTIYASQNRLGDECTTETEYVTCDACIGARLDDSCSTRYVRNDSYVLFIFTAETNGSMMVTGLNDVALPFRILGGQTSSIKRIAVKWADMKNNFAVKGLGMIKLHVGEETLDITVRTGNIPQFKQSHCDESSAHGICDFEIDRVGDQRLISISTNGLQSRHDDAFDYAGFRIFAMPVASSDECKESSKACSEANGPGSLSFDVRVSADMKYDDKFMMDFSQGQKYCVRVANIDVAKNLSSATATCRLIE